MACREQRRAGASHDASWVAAVEAILAVWPIPLIYAKCEATHAIAYASANHRAISGMALAVLPE